MTPPLSGLLPESCDILGEISTAFNGSELPMQMETLPAMVPGGPHGVNTFQSKVCGFPPASAPRLSPFSLCYQGLQGTKAMLNSAFHLKGFNLSTLKVPREVIHNCGQQAHRNTARVGMWMWFYTIWLVRLSNHWTNPPFVFRPRRIFSWWL